MRLTSVLRGHDHHSEIPKVPDYRIYKVEDVPELLKVKENLAKMGLKDPWLRNEVWRFDPCSFGTKKERLNMLWKRGFVLGFGAFVIHMSVQGLWNMMYPAEHHDRGYWRRYEHLLDGKTPGHGHGHK